MVNAASITLLTPIAAMVGLAAGIPLLALVLVSRRDQRLRIALGLSGRRRLLRARDVLAIGLLFLLLAATWRPTSCSTFRAQCWLRQIREVRRDSIAQPGSHWTFARTWPASVSVWPPSPIARFRTCFPPLIGAHLPR